MANRTVSVSLQAKVAGFVSGMRTASKAAGDFGDKVTQGSAKHKQSLNDLAGATGVVGAAMVGAAGFAVKAFADFESAMSGVQAATHESAANMDLLKDAALDAGARTVFSATEAAEAIENLAKAGVSTTDILGGGLDGALDLAAAGSLEVADAAEIAATAMTQFRLTGEDIPHVADLLAAGAGKAQGEVSDLAAALNQSGLVASQFGLSIDETVGTLSAFAAAGLLGSDAGTSFKTMLLALANPAEKTRATMEQLGIAAYDAQGNFVGIAGLAQQLKEKLDPLPQAQRDAALAQIFGNDAIRAANVLMKQGADGIDTWIEKVDDQGFAAETAAIKLDNLKGDLEGFLGSLETALIGVGEGANGPLRELVQGATDVVNKFNELPDGAKSATLAIVGGGGLVLLGIAGLSKLAVGISDTKNALQDLGLTGKRVGGALKFAGVVAAVAALGTIASEVGEQFGGLNEDVQDVANSLEGFASKGKATGSAAKLAGEDFGRLSDAVARLGNPSSFEKFSNFAGTYLSPFRDNVDLAKISVEKMDEALVNLASSGGAEDASAAFAEITRLAKEQSVPVEKLRELFPQYTAVIRSTGDAQETFAGKTDDTKKSVEDVEPPISDAAAALKEMDARAKDLIDSLELLNGTMSEREALANYEGAVDDAAERVKEFKEEQKKAEAGTKDMKGAFDLGAEAGRNNEEALRDLWEQAGAYATQALKVEGNQKKANQILQTGRQRLVDTAIQFGLTRKQAEDYVTEVLGIPPDVSTEIEQPGMAGARSDAKGLKTDLGKLPRTTKTTVSTPGLSSTVNQVEAVILGLNRIDGRRATAYVGVSISGANRRLLDQARAGGGPVMADTPYLVGEEGPELFVPGQNGQIIPNRPTERMMSGRDLMRGVPTPVGGDGASGGGDFTGTLYLDSGELLGVVRGQIRHENQQLKRRVGAGTGSHR